MNNNQLFIRSADCVTALTLTHVGITLASGFNQAGFIVSGHRGFSAYERFFNNTKLGTGTFSASPVCFLSTVQRQFFKYTFPLEWLRLSELEPL